MTDDVKAGTPIYVTSRLVCQEGEINSFALGEVLCKMRDINESVGPLHELAVPLHGTALDSVVNGPV